MSEKAFKIWVLFYKILCIAGLWFISIILLNSIRDFWLFGSREALNLISISITVIVWHLIGFKEEQLKSKDKKENER